MSAPGKTQFLSLLYHVPTSGTLLPCYVAWKQRANQDIEVFGSSLFTVGNPTDAGKGEPLIVILAPRPESGGGQNAKKPYTEPNFDPGPSQDDG